MALRQGRSQIHGNGLVAARDISSGELLVGEGVLFNWYTKDDEEAMADLIVERIREWTDEECKAFKQMAKKTVLVDKALGHTMTADSFWAHIDDDDEISMIALFFSEVFWTHCFPARPQSRVPEWLLLSKPLQFNHSCTPTAEASYDPGSGQFKVRAIRDISTGYEVTIAYTDVYAPRDERWDGLGFTCRCSLCSAPIEDTWRTEERRKASQTGLSAVRTWCNWHFGREMPIACFETKWEEVAADEKGTALISEMAVETLKVASEDHGPLHSGVADAREVLCIVNYVNYLNQQRLKASLEDKLEQPILAADDDKSGSGQSLISPKPHATLLSEINECEQEMTRCLKAAHGHGLEMMLILQRHFGVEHECSQAASDALLKLAEDAVILQQ